MKASSAYLKMRVLGAIETAEGNTIRKRIEHVSTMRFIDEDGEPRQFTWRTIQTWYSRFKKDGITGVKPKSRKDKGKARAITPEQLRDAINRVLPHFQKDRLNRFAVMRKIISLGIIPDLAKTTFYRFVKEYDLFNPTLDQSKLRLAFSMQYANQLWQADTMFGPHVMCQDGNKKQAKLIAFIDDASRVLCHGEFFTQENTGALVQALRSAFYKRGVPEQLYVDNGAIYSGAEITLVCARVGCILRHTPVRDGAAKGKIERFFRRVRDQFLCQALDLSSLAALNRQFTEGVEAEYNSVNHLGIGMKPIDRFGLDLSSFHFQRPMTSFSMQNPVAPSRRIILSVSRVSVMKRHVICAQRRSRCVMIVQGMTALWFITGILGWVKRSGWIR